MTRMSLASDISIQSWDSCYKREQIGWRIKQECVQGMTMSTRGKKMIVGGVIQGEAYRTQGARHMWNEIMVYGRCGHPT